MIQRRKKNTYRFAYSKKKKKNVKPFTIEIHKVMANYKQIKIESKV